MIAACGGSEGPLPTGSEAAGSVGRAPPEAAGAAGATSVPGSWAETPCGMCVVRYCEKEMVDCDLDSDCHEHLECLGKCASAENDVVDLACERRCPPPSTTRGSALLARVSDCRTWSESEMCNACPYFTGAKPADAEPSPLLNQSCADPGGDTCAACIESNCCETALAYQTSPAREHFQGCLDDCIREGGMSPYECFSTCETQAPGGLEKYASHDVCVWAHCAQTDACGSTEPSECDACLRANCAPEIAHCNGNADCVLLNICYLSCPSTDAVCQDRCSDQHGTARALTLWLDRTNCILEKCDQPGVCFAADGARGASDRSLPPSARLGLGR